MIQIRGVHPIEATEPVHLVDVAITGTFDDVDWAGVTQPDASMAESDWQVAYDEQELPPLSDGRARAVFFFHYLEPTAPLRFGSELVTLPTPTPVPSDLADVQYEEP